MELKKEKKKKSKENPKKIKRKSKENQKKIKRKSKEKEKRNQRRRIRKAFDIPILWNQVEIHPEAILEDWLNNESKQCQSLQHSYNATWENQKKKWSSPEFGRLELDGSRIYP